MAMCRLAQTTALGLLSARQIRNVISEKNEDDCTSEQPTATMCRADSGPRELAALQNRQGYHRPTCATAQCDASGVGNGPTSWLCGGRWGPWAGGCRVAPVRSRLFSRVCKQLPGLFVRAGDLSCWAPQRLPVGNPLRTAFTSELLGTPLATSY